MDLDVTLEELYTGNFVEVSYAGIILGFGSAIERWHFIDALVQDCSNSSALATELLQSCTNPSIL